MQQQHGQRRTQHHRQQQAGTHQQKVAQIAAPVGAIVMDQALRQDGRGAQVCERDANGSERQHIAELTKLVCPHLTGDHQQQQQVRPDRQQAGQTLGNDVRGELTMQGHGCD